MDNHQNNNKAAKAVILLSGGLDSTTTLAIAGDQGFECYCLSFDYGQRSRIELEKAKRIGEAFGVRHHFILHLDLDRIGGSALTDDLDVPKGRDLSDEYEIPVTYVPARNIIFLSHALAWAEVIGAGDIFIGVNAVDYSGYPDCRPEFIESFTRMANLGTGRGDSGFPFRIHTPLIRLSKGEIIEWGTQLGVDYSLTHSCYDPIGEQPCGQCDACRLRLRGFAEAGMNDPLKYRERP